MGNAAADGGALNESIAFLEYFSGLKDPRQQGKVIYPLNEVLLLCLLAVLAGAETFVDIALFGEKKPSLLRRLLPYANGTPQHGRLGEIFAALDPEVFQRCFVSWVAAITGIPAGSRAGGVGLGVGHGLSR
jgi:DDE_Tnp_1-associated